MSNMQTISNIREHPILTKQENAIARDFCDECLSDKEVADKRNISINTVQTHKKSIFSKFGINKITQLSKIYFTTFCMATLLSLSGMARTSLRMSFRIESRRSYAGRMYKRSRRRTDFYYAEANTYFFPIAI